MTGGPSQIDTFDPKPGHANGGPFKPIETAVPGIRISEHLPKLAKQMKDLALIRSMSTKEGDHGRARTTSGPATCRRGRSGTRRSARWWPRSWRTSGRAAQLRQHRALPRVQPGRLRTRVPRPEYAPLIVGERRLGRAIGPGRRRGRAEGRGPRPPRRHRPPAGRRPARPARRLDADFLASHPGVRPRATDGLSTGREDDAVVSGQGVRPRRGAGRAPRRLRPEPVRPGLPAGPPAGRAGRAVRRGHALGASTGSRRSAGTRTSRTSTPSRSSAACSTPAGRP